MVLGFVLFVFFLYSQQKDFLRFMTEVSRFSGLVRLSLEIVKWCFYGIFVGFTRRLLELTMGLLSM